MRTSKLIFLFLFTLIAIHVHADPRMIIIKPSDNNISYIGRVDRSNLNIVVFAFPAVTIKTIFTGDKIGLVLEDLPYGDDHNFLNVIIDNQEPELLQLKDGKNIYYFSPTEKKSEHLISIVKRTESMIGKVAFYGFELNKTQKLQPVNNLPKRTIEFIGNSITCGYGNEVTIPAPPEGNPNTGFTARNENAYMSYASITGRKLNANVVLTSYSGKGIYRNFDGDTSNTLPKIYDLIFPDEQDGPIWNTDSIQPDLIVINLGTNDYYLESQDKPINDSIFIRTYISFIQKLKNINPDATFLCVIGPMTNDYWPEGKNCHSRLQKCIKEVEVYINGQSGEKKVYSTFFSPQQAPYGEDWHPALHTHKKMADQLSSFINENIWNSK